MTEFIKIVSKPNVIDEFDEQDEYILSRVKEKNVFLAKNIIARYGLAHPLDSYFKKYRNDFDGLQQALSDFSKKRKADLLELTKDL